MAEAEEPEDPDLAPERSPLDVFNSSGQARKVAGLVRSLGEPRVSVRLPGPNTALIVVAWDLSWYRWRVKGETVSELSKGNEISELPANDRDWNASAAEDGTLTLTDRSRRLVANVDGGARGIPARRRSRRWPPPRGGAGRDR